MAKYRSLNIKELKDLEKEFVEFLIVGGITPEDWELLLESNPEKVGQTLELFSDVVFESVIQKIKFLENRSHNFVYVYQCLEEQIVLVGLTNISNEEIDFTQPEMLSSYMLNPPKGLKVFTSSKSYVGNRETELFQMLENGCVITDDKLFKALCLCL